MAPTTAALRKFYVYDPGLHVGDELGRLRVLEDDKGIHVMAPPVTMQYWIDQGMVGLLPLDELSESSKKFLAQITRGRSLDNDEQPKKLPKYDRQIQSGSPGSALKQPLSQERRKAMAKSKKKEGKDKDSKKPKKEEKKAEDKPGFFNRPAE